VGFFRCMITCHAHTSGVAMSAATERGYESLPHPFYLIDLAPSEALTSICDFIVSTEDFLRGEGKSRKTGIQKLQEQWNKCIEARGKYVEK